MTSASKHGWDYINQNHIPQITESRCAVSRYCPLWAFLFKLSFTVFKTCLLGEVFHTLIKNVSFSSLANVGFHNPPTLGAQRPRWHSLLSPIDVGSHNPPTFGAQHPRWHSFLSPIDVRSHSRHDFRDIE